MFKKTSVARLLNNRPTLCVCVCVCAWETGKIFGAFNQPLASPLPPDFFLLLKIHLEWSKVSATCRSHLKTGVWSIDLIHETSEWSSCRSSRWSSFVSVRSESPRLFGPYNAASFCFYLDLCTSFVITGLRTSQVHADNSLDFARGLRPVLSPLLTCSGEKIWIYRVKCYRSH